VGVTPEPINMPSGILSGVPDIITHAKFYINRLRGFSVAVPQKCHLLYFFEWPLQQFCTTVQTVIFLRGSTSWMSQHFSTFLSSVTCSSPVPDFQLGIAIPGSRNSRIPGSRKFSNPEIPGLSGTQSRDFGINKIYWFNGLFNIILCIYSFFDAFLHQQWRGEGAVVRADMRLHWGTKRQIASSFFGPLGIVACQSRFGDSIFICNVK